MIVETETVKPKFTPIKLIITIESKPELDNLYDEFSKLSGVAYPICEQLITLRDRYL